MNLGALPLARAFAALLDGLGIDYVIGGSVASSLVGEPRATVDLDIAVMMTAADMQPLLEALGDGYYVSEAAVRDAVRRRGSCNVIHLATMQKVDVFVLGDGLLDRLQLSRRNRSRSTRTGPDDSGSVPPPTRSSARCGETASVPRSPNGNGATSWPSFGCRVTPSTSATCGPPPEPSTWKICCSGRSISSTRTETGRSRPSSEPIGATAGPGPTSRSRRRRPW